MRETRAIPARLARLGLVAAAAVAAATMTAAPAAALGEIQDVGPNAIPNSYIVVYKDTVSAALDTLTSDLAGKYDAKVTHSYTSALRGFAANMSETAARQLAADPAVAYVSQDREVHATATQPNPPSWGLDRVDQRNLPLQAQYHFSGAAPNITAYIIDTGIRVTHADFGGRASFAVNTTGDGINTDCNGHGTHVAGTAGGGAFGVAKSIRLVAVKVLNCAGSGSFAGVIAGVDWVTANSPGPSVANMSLGAPGTNAAVEAAVRNSIASGVTYAIASGNSFGADACNFTPARVLEAITVNASSINDVRASFSNIGACTDIFAPGEGITSAWSTSDTATNTISGTSMATPHVAGGAALYLSTNPGASPPQVAAKLLNNATVNKIGNAGAGSPNRLLYTEMDRLNRGPTTLTAGQFIRSQNDLYTLVMQTDGNLVLYNQFGQPLWHTNTFGNPGAFCVMQTDGNFVVYRADGFPLWHTATHGTAAVILVVQNDSNVVIYGPTGQVFWHRLQ